MDVDYVRNKLKKGKFSMKEISEKLNISQQNLYNKLQSKDLKVNFLFELARAVNENVYYFFGDEFDNAGGGRIKPFNIKSNNTKNAENVVEKKDHKNDHIFNTKPKVQKTSVMETPVSYDTTNKSAKKNIQAQKSIEDIIANKVIEKLLPILQPYFETTDLLEALEGKRLLEEEETVKKPTSHE